MRTVEYAEAAEDSALEVDYSALQYVAHPTASLRPMHLSAGH